MQMRDGPPHWIDRTGDPWCTHDVTIESLLHSGHTGRVEGILTECFKCRALWSIYWQPEDVGFFAWSWTPYRSIYDGGSLRA